MPDSKDKPQGSDDFTSPSKKEVEAAASDENAGVQFQAPTESVSEQAAFTAAPEAMAGVPSTILEARGALEEVIRSQTRDSGVLSVEAFAGDVGNVQGVGIGLGEPGGPGEPGSPTLAVFVAEKTSSDVVRSVVVESLGIQAAADVPISVHESGVIDAQPHRFYVRPAPGGVSVGHYKITAGTIGCLSVGRSAPRNSRLMVTSNNHVLANVNNAVFGDCITQPGKYDGGRCPTHQIAILERFVPITMGGATNYVDCATGWAWPDRVRRELIYLSGGAAQYFRISNAPLYPQLGGNVGKTGRTTQLTAGRVSSPSTGPDGSTTASARPGLPASSWCRATAGTSAQEVTPGRPSGRGTRQDARLVCSAVAATPSAIRCPGSYPHWISTSTPEAAEGPSNAG